MNEHQTGKHVPFPGFTVQGNRIFYLALPPGVVPSTMERLDQAGLLKSHGWVRVVFEKPFGHDLASAQELIANVPIP